jgi:NitT/TauT family transport system permease protein
MAAALKSVALRASSILALILLWWAAAAVMNNPQILPTPLVIVKTIAADLQTRGPEGESAWFDIGITLARIVVTFAASMIAGIGIGLAMGLNRLCERSLLALLPLMLTMPTILMVFVAIMWFGFSEAGGLVAVMAVVTPLIAVNIFEGTKAMDKSLAEMGATFKAPRSLLLRKVYLPQLMPYIFSAFRYGSARPGRSWRWPRPSASNSASATCSSSGSSSSISPRRWPGS